MRGLCTFAFAVALSLGCGQAQLPPSIKVIVETAGADGVTPQALTADSTLTAGAQGGFHVWLNLKVTGAKADATRIKHTIRRKSDGVLFSTGDRTLRIGEPGPDGSWETSPAWPAFLCPSPLGVNVLGETAVIKLELSTVAGEVLGSGEVTTKFTCPAAQQTFCDSICKG